jgi:hypothetical protein
MSNRKFVPLLLLLTVMIMGSCDNQTSPIQDQFKLAPTPSTLPSLSPVRTPKTSKYEPNDGSFFGLYYVESKGIADERKLIISEDDQPIPPKANDPDEATVPGFYLSHENRLDFEEVEVSGNRVYFKTVATDGVVYEFLGTANKEIDPNFSEDVPIPFIKGQLKMIKIGSVIKTESAKFGHAIIA